MKTKIDVLKLVHTYLVSFPVFALENQERIPVFLLGVEGKERVKKNYVRDKFVEINCLYHSFENGTLNAIINVNVQAENIDWINEVRSYLRLLLDCLKIDNIVFYRISSEVFRVSRTLTMSNDRYELRNDNLNPSESIYMEGFWKSYKENI